MPSLSHRSHYDKGPSYITIFLSLIFGLEGKYEGTIGADLVPHEPDI